MRKCCRRPRPRPRRSGACCWIWWRRSDLEEGDDMDGDVRDSGLAPGGRGRVGGGGKERPGRAASPRADVAAALAEAGIPTQAIRGEDHDTYFGHINAVLDTRPQITMDDGCDMVSLLQLQ